MQKQSSIWDSGKAAVTDVSPGSQGNDTDQIAYHYNREDYSRIGRTGGCRQYRRFC